MPKFKSIIIPTNFCLKIPSLISTTQRLTSTITWFTINSFRCIFFPNDQSCLLPLLNRNTIPTSYPSQRPLLLNHHSQIRSINFQSSSLNFLINAPWPLKTTDSNFFTKLWKRLNTFLLNSFKITVAIILPAVLDTYHTTQWLSLIST